MDVAESATWGQCYYRPELVNRYISFLHEPLLPTLDLRGMKIVLDLAWGSATRVAAQVFQQTGAEVIVIHGTPDGDRINVDCGSTHLGPLKAAVKTHQADLGFAFDGDADRVMAVDAEGRVVDGDYILYFWGQRLRDQQRLPDNTVVSTVMANLGFERAWEKTGRHPGTHQSGRSACLCGNGPSAVPKLGAVSSPATSSAHHYSLTGDGILTALHLFFPGAGPLGCSLAALVDQSFQTYPQLLQNVRVNDRERRLHWQEVRPRAAGQSTKQNRPWAAKVRVAGASPFGH